MPIPFTSYSMLALSVALSGLRGASLRGSLRPTWVYFVNGIGIVAFLGLQSCTNPTNSELATARQFVEEKKFDEAIDYYQRVVKRNYNSESVVKACRELTQIYQFQKKDYPKAIEFYRRIITKSLDRVERLEAQKNIASIVFNNLQDYKAAIVEYDKLLAYDITDFENGQTHLILARANFYLNNFFQAQSEIDVVLKLKVGEELQFEARLIRSNIALSQKDYKLAIEILTGLLKDFEERSINGNIPITLAVCYEELGDFKLAIETLVRFREKYPNKKDFIELRVKKLKERQQNQPGARGLRK